MSRNQNGLSNTRLYRIHRSMKDRCYKENHKSYKDYGERGIRVCEEWLGKDGFLNFYSWAMNNGYSDDLTIERKNMDGNYEPDNCCWITMEEQQKNKRSNVYVMCHGKRMIVAKAAAVLGVQESAVRYRAENGISLDKEFGTRKAVVRDDGVVYESIRQAAKENGVHEAKIGDVCRGLRKRTAGHSFRFLTREEAKSALAEKGGV